MKRREAWFDSQLDLDPVYLPPYSPDFNPIEKAFSKLKALLHKAAERSVDALWNRIGALLNEFTPTECANFFAAAGYEPLREETALVRRLQKGPRRRLLRTACLLSPSGEAIFFVVCSDRSRVAAQLRFDGRASPPEQ